MKPKNLQCVLLMICCIYVTSCARLPRERQLQAIAENHNASQLNRASPSAAPLVNINTATGEELERLPGIGAGFAARIIEHRTRYGIFRRKEHLLIVRGMGERRYRELEAFITTGGGDK